MMSTLRRHWGRINEAQHAPRGRVAALDEGVELPGGEILAEHAFGDARMGVLDFAGEAAGGQPRDGDIHGVALERNRPSSDACSGSH
jgi:hypothetical protein